MLNQTFKNKIGLSKNENMHKNKVWKHQNKTKYPNWNTSVLPLKQRNIFLDSEFRRVVKWNKEFMRNINQVNFPSYIGDFGMSLDLKKTNMLIDNLVKMQLR